MPPPASSIFNLPLPFFCDLLQHKSMECPTRISMGFGCHMKEPSTGISIKLHPSIRISINSRRIASAQLLKKVQADGIVPNKNVIHSTCVAVVPLNHSLAGGYTHAPTNCSAREEIRAAAFS